MVSKIVIKKDDKLELHVNWDPKKSVTRTTESSVRSGGNGLSQPLSQTFFPHLYYAVNSRFIWLTPLNNKVFLTQKYVKESLSARQIAVEIDSSKSAVT